jgi:outer membrane cobalamin receptor
LQGQMTFKVNNLLNEDYQVIAWYPMPRRHFAVSVRLKFPV